MKTVFNYLSEVSSKIFFSPIIVSSSVVENLWKSHRKRLDYARRDITAFLRIHAVVFCSFFLLSCSGVMKKRYSSGFYFEHHSEIKHDPVAKNNSANKVSLPKKAAVIPTVNFFSTKTEEVKKDFVVYAPPTNKHAKKNFLPTNIPQTNIVPAPKKESPAFIDQPSNPQKPIWQFSVSIFFLLLCLLGIVCGFIYGLLPLEILAYIFGVFPEAWFLGVLFAMFGYFKFRRLTKGIEQPKQRLNFFSRWAFILELAQFGMIPVMIIMLVIAVFNVYPLIISVVLTCLFALCGFVFAIIGLIKEMRNPDHTRRNILRSLLLSVTSWVPIIVMLIWLVAIGSALYAALPYLAALIFLLH